MRNRHAYDNRTCLKELTYESTPVRCCPNFSQTSGRHCNNVATQPTAEELAVTVRPIIVTRGTCGIRPHV
eukprot:1721407-Amphidinium_carterae.1